MFYLCSHKQIGYTGSLTLWNQQNGRRPAGAGWPKVARPEWHRASHSLGRPAPPLRPSRRKRDLIFSSARAGRRQRDFSLPGM